MLSEYQIPENAAGRLACFEDNLDALLRYAEVLIASDEIEKAEWLLTRGMPGFYRDHPPKQVEALKKKLYGFLMDVADYAKAPDDIRLVNPEFAKSNIDYLLRGRLMRDSMKALNEKGIVPHIHEMGPGEYWLPIGLKEHGFKFTYSCSFLSLKAFQKAYEHMRDFLVDEAPKDAPQIFVACEIIEHLRDENEIPHCMIKAGLDPIEIHLSTPYYTYGPGIPDWDSEAKRGFGGHLRTYTPTEFLMTASRLFPRYQWHYYGDVVQSAVGRKV